MVKKIVSMIIVLALVFAGGYYTCLQLAPKEVEEATGPVYVTKDVKKGDIQVGVNITGRLDSNYGGAIYAPSLESSSEKIKYVLEELNVKENDLIKKGSFVARLSCKNLPDLLKKKRNEIEKKQHEIDSKMKELSRILNKNIININTIDPSEGVVITAKIDGKVRNLNVKQGQKVSSSNIAKIVKDNQFIISFKTSIADYSKLINNNKKIKIMYSGFEGIYDASITELSDSPIVATIDKPGSLGGSVQQYVHTGVIVATNPGLIPIGAKVGIYLDNGTDEVSSPLYFTGDVDSYLDESTLITNHFSSRESDNIYIASEVYVKNNQVVKKGDPVVRIIGQSITNEIKTKIADIQNLRSDLGSLQEGMAELNKFESKLKVYATQDGIISYIRHEVGEEFSASSGETWELRLVNVYDATKMYVNTQVSDLDVVYVEEGADVNVTVDALPNKKFKGKVERKYQYSNRDNGEEVYEVNISVEGEEGLRPGMKVNCFVDAGKSLDTMLVPIESVVEDDDKLKVEILKEDGSTELVEIEVGLMNDRYVEVKSGLEVGQKVVVASKNDLMPSQKVENDSSLIPGQNK